MSASRICYKIGSNSQSTRIENSDKVVLKCGFVAFNGLDMVDSNLNCHLTEPESIESRFEFAPKAGGVLGAFYTRRTTMLPSIGEEHIWI